MNAAGIIWDAISGVLKAANAILSVVPGLVWALALFAAVTWGGWQRHEVNVAGAAKERAEAARAQATGEKNQVLAQLAQQKRDAKAQLDALTAARDALQQRVNDQRAQQEKRDADTKAVIEDQARRLRDAAAAHGGQLRDPNAAGCRSGRAAAESQPAPVAGDRPADGTEAGGLLSTQLTGLLERVLGEADDINRAYTAARADALTCRSAIP